MLYKVEYILKEVISKENNIENEIMKKFNKLFS